ncbi:hypothetical protein NDU88_000831 [Pleurodeles waltl]|uniref:Uncharacterized protein n=1 Tax=Pleurodeles waltl TaxID=8319 RepID=A0AAV7KNQ1_PLEWA|nr:hypothetical protein NDU88_000831 [Pleurodeles waltl]
MRRGVASRHLEQFRLRPGSIKAIGNGSRWFSARLCVGSRGNPKAARASGDFMQGSGKTRQVFPWTDGGGSGGAPARAGGGSPWYRSTGCPIPQPQDTGLNIARRSLCCISSDVWGFLGPVQDPDELCYLLKFQW